MHPHFVRIKGHVQRPTCENVSLFHCVVNATMVNMHSDFVVLIVTWNACLMKSKIQLANDSASSNDFTSDKKIQMIFETIITKYV